MIKSTLGSYLSIELVISSTIMLALCKCAGLANATTDLTRGGDAAEAADLDAFRSCPGGRGGAAGTQGEGYCDPVSTLERNMVLKLIIKAT